MSTAQEYSILRAQIDQFHKDNPECAFVTTFLVPLVSGDEEGIMVDGKSNVTIHEAADIVNALIDSDGPMCEVLSGMILRSVELEIKRRSGKY